MKGRLIYVMGPSGAGKDSLLGFARERLAGGPVLFAHRYITRAAGHYENHVALTVEEFDARSALGLFALEWASHRLRYGIGMEIDAWLTRGCTVVVNGSRQHVAQALERYPRIEVVHIDAPPHVLAVRLAARARESAEQVNARLTRQAPFQLPDCVQFTTIDNGGELQDAGHAFVEVIRRAVST
jgi:ribose 1,5-bisphosphokinase